MRYIVENDLKTSYRQAPFTQYTLQKDTRLTPEARQFLIDRKIELIDLGKKQVGTFEKKGQESSVLKEENIHQLLIDCQKLSALSLICLTFLLDEDVQAAQKVSLVNDYLVRLQQTWMLGTELPEVFLPEDVQMPEIEADVPVVTAFHVQLQKGRTIALLNYFVMELKQFSLQLGKGNQTVVNETVQRFIWLLMQCMNEVIGGEQ